MRAILVAFVALTMCGTTTSDPRYDQGSDPCNGQCTSTEFCYSETAGTLALDGATSSYCKPSPPCGNDCSCLSTKNGCGTAGMECGVAEDGTHVLHCINN